MTDHPPRQVTLLLCDPEGHLLGTLPPFEVELPWWQDMSGVVTGARKRHGVEVNVLRLVEAATGWGTAGRAVTYLAEVAAAPRVALTPWAGADPLAGGCRPMTARPG